jgi:hypothetical protein
MLGVVSVAVVVAIPISSSSPGASPAGVLEGGEGEEGDATFDCNTRRD